MLWTEAGTVDNTPWMAGLLQGNHCVGDHQEGTNTVYLGPLEDVLHCNMVALEAYDPYTPTILHG